MDCRYKGETPTTCDIKIKSKTGGGEDAAGEFKGLLGCFVRLLSCCLLYLGIFWGELKTAVAILTEAHLEGVRGWGGCVAWGGEGPNEPAGLSLPVILSPSRYLSSVKSGQSERLSNTVPLKSRC